MRLLRFLPMAAFLLPTQVLAAQPWDFDFGLDVLVGTPTGDFKQHVNALGGIAVQGVFAARLSPLALRIDGSMQIYGSETQRIPIAGLPPQINQEVETDHWLARLDIGPEFRATSGSVRPFLNPFVGVSYFSTSSSLSGPYPLGMIATSTNYDDTAFSYGVGGGVRVMVGDGGGAISLSARYVRSSRVSYLTNGDIMQTSTGSLLFTPQHSTADTIEFRVGYAFGAGGPRR